MECQRKREGCFECHLPQTKNVKDEVAQELVRAAMDKDMETLGKVNANCLICHNEKAILDQWTDGPAADNAVYGSKEGPHTDAPVFTEIKQSPTIEESIFCLTGFPKPLWRSR